MTISDDKLASDESIAGRWQRICSQVSVNIERMLFHLLPVSFLQRELICFAKQLGPAYSAVDADVSLDKTIFSVRNRPLILAVRDTGVVMVSETC